MIVTRKFLLKHRTEAQSWTAAQFEILGLPWPPKQGWVSRIKGHELSDEEAQAFIVAKGITRTSTMPKIKALILALNEDELSHLREWVSTVKTKRG